MKIAYINVMDTVKWELHHQLVQLKLTDATIIIQKRNPNKKL